MPQHQAGHRQPRRHAPISEIPHSLLVMRDNNPSIIRRPLQNILIRRLRQTHIPGVDNVDARQMPSRLSQKNGVDIFVSQKLQYSALNQSCVLDSQ